VNEAEAQSNRQSMVLVAEGSILSDWPLKRIESLVSLGPSVRTPHSTIDFVHDPSIHSNLALKTFGDKSLAYHEKLVLENLARLNCPYIIPLLDAFRRPDSDLTLVLPKLDPFDGKKLDLLDIQKHLKQMAKVLVLSQTIQSYKKVH
jgi:hypothetical protein